MYRVYSVDRVSLFATRNETKRPPAAVAPPGAASSAPGLDGQHVAAVVGCPGVFR
jgi:hypothetical protein